MGTVGGAPMYTHAVVQQHRSTPLPLTGFLDSSRTLLYLGCDRGEDWAAADRAHSDLTKSVLGKQSDSLP